MNDSFPSRVLHLIDAIDELTAQQNLKLTKQPPDDWTHGNREAWCIGFLEGQIVLSNKVCHLLATFVQETEQQAAQIGGKAS